MQKVGHALGAKVSFDHDSASGLCEKVGVLLQTAKTPVDSEGGGCVSSLQEQTTPAFCWVSLLLSLSLLNIDSLVFAGCLQAHTMSALGAWA